MWVLDRSLLEEGLPGFSLRAANEPQGRNSELLVRTKVPVALWLIAFVLIFHGCDKNYFTFPCWLQESTLRFSRQLEDIAKRIFGLQPKETTARVEISLLLGKSPGRCLWATDTCNGQKYDHKLSASSTAELSVFVHRWRSVTSAPAK